MSLYFKMLVFCLLTFTSKNLFAQANPNPCDFPNVTCQDGGANGIIFSFGSDTMVYAAPDRRMPFWVGVGDTVTNAIDTSLKTQLIFIKKSGPGEMLGSATGAEASYVYFNDIEFTESGIYILDFVSGVELSWNRELIVKVLEESDFCVNSPAGACGSVSGNQLFAMPMGSNVIPVDAVLPINVGAIDSITGLLDSTFSGTIYVEQQSGPGVLYGTLSMTGRRWFTFSDLRFSEEGFYLIRFYEEGGTKFEDANLIIEVINVEGVTKIVSVNPLNVYPNPIKNQFSITSKTDLKNTFLEVYDFSGRKVFERYITESTYQVSVNSVSLKSGVYLVKVSSGENTFSNVKIVK